MTRFFSAKSESTPPNMEGLSSSTAAIRNKRDDWLSRNKLGMAVKLVATVVVVIVLSVAIIVSVPLIKKHSVKQVKLNSTYHNTVKNGTYESGNLDDMLKSYGYGKELEKDGLQICDLNPESRGELGKGTWTLLHIMASTYPVIPSPEIKQDHKIFFQLLPRIYPCPDCRGHMRQMFQEFPPQLDSRRDFMLWLCEAHNMVNRRLNKPTFDCEKLDDRWDCGCNIVPGQAINAAPVIGANEVVPEISNRQSRARKSEKKDRESKTHVKKSDASPANVNHAITLKPELTKAPTFQTGDRVLIEGPSSVDGNEGFERSGTVRYIGKTEFKEGDWLGVELDTPTGKNDGSVAGVRYFTCEPFHGLFVPPNKARLNLSGDSVFGEGMFLGSSRRLSNPISSSTGDNTMNFSTTPSKQSAFGAVGVTPNHLDRIENLQMDFSAVKDISDSFAGPQSSLLKTPTANVKSQSTTPATSELKNTQNDIFRLRDQIMSIKADLRNNSGESSSNNRETVDSIVNKLSGMLESYEQVSGQYENQLKQFLMARKASKLDSSGTNEELSQKFSQEKTQILNEFDKLQVEYEKVRNDLYNEIKENDSLKNRFSGLEEELGRMRQRLSQQDEELKKCRFEGVRSRTELEIELIIEEEQRKRSMEHDNEMKLLKARHDEELKQKKYLISDLQNEVAFLKQSEKVLEEELNSREMSGRRYSTESGNDYEISSAKRQAEEFKRLWEDAQAAKMRSEEYYRGELERARKESAENGEFDELKRDLKELSGRLKQTRADNEELTWALETSNKETERLNGLIEEQAQRISEREKKLQSFSERIQELESREVQSRESEGLQSEIKRLSLELGEERLKATGPIEQVSALKRKVSLIEREKELLEEQVRTVRLSAYSQGEFQTFSTFIQGLKRHVEAEILSIEPLKLTLQDVVRAKEMVDILLKVTEDVRVKVLNHLSQVEEVIKSRFSTTMNNNGPTNTEVDTVKIERVRNYDSNNLADLRRRIDFRSEEQPRTLREPLGVTSIPSQYVTPRDRPVTSQFSRSSSSSSDHELENRMNNFRNLVSDLRSRQPVTSSTIPAATRPSTSSSYYPQSSFIRAHDPIRCNLCQEYGHDALSCPDYLSGADSFSEDLFLKDVRNSKFSSRFSERTRV